MSFAYHIHLQSSSLEEDPFRKSQTRKSDFPSSGPAKQARNPKIKPSPSPSVISACSSPSPALCFPPGHGQHWLQAACCVGRMLSWEEQVQSHQHAVLGLSCWSHLSGMGKREMIDFFWEIYKRQEKMQQHNQTLILSKLGRIFSLTSRGPCALAAPQPGLPLASACSQESP